MDPEVEHCYVSEEDEGVLEPASCSATCEESEAAKENTGEAVTSIVPRADRFNFCGECMLWGVSLECQPLNFRVQMM